MPELKRILINFPADKSAVHANLRRVARELGVPMTRIVIEAIDRFTRNPEAGISRPGKKKGGKS